MKRLIHDLGYLISAALFMAAVVIIHHELKQYHYHDIVQQLRNTSYLVLVAGLVLTAIDYVVLTFYDTLGLHYVHHPLGYARTGPVAFIGYAFGNNATILSGSAIRYRLYSSLGVSASEVAQLVVFCAVTFWLGVFALGGAVLTWEHGALPAVLHLPFQSTLPVGVVSLAIVAFYVVAVVLRKRPFVVHGWNFYLPSLRICIGQILISSLDWALAAGVLYVFLPQDLGLTYSKFLGIFLLAQMAGLFSLVPGGLGVFESVILLLMSDFDKPAALVSSLLLYRLFYYLVPLMLASLLLGFNEFLSERRFMRQVGQVLSHIAKSTVPQVFAFSTFIAGAMLLFSGALPPVKGRMALLRDFLPLPAIEISHFLGSVAGAALLILARGIQRRIDVAFHMTVAILTAGIVFSLLKGFDYEEAVILVLMLVAFLPCKKEFYRQASLLHERFSLEWVISIVVVAVCSVWLGLFSYRHVEYSHSLWWRFALDADASRFLRATAAGVIVLLLYFLTKLYLPPKAPAVAHDTAESERIQGIVESCPRTDAWLALLGDKTFFFDESRTTFIMYAVQGRSWVAIGEPIGPEDKWRELVWNFRELCDKYNGWPVFYQVGKERLDLFLDMGLTFLKLGEEGRVNLQEFSLQGAAHSGLRHSRNKIQKQDYTFSIVASQRVPEIMQQMKEVSDQWLAQKHTREKRFTLGYFNPEYLARTPVAIIQRDDRIWAFANILIGANKEEMSIDLMRFLPSGPGGMMDYLFIEILLWAKAQGYRWFNFGMAPLSGIEDRALAPFWSHAEVFIFKHGEHFYNYQGLRQYKEKFDPQWRPKYLACPRGIMLPMILANITSLVCGDMRGIVTK